MVQLVEREDRVHGLAAPQTALEQQIGGNRRQQRHVPDPVESGMILAIGQRRVEKGGNDAARGIVKRHGVHVRGCVFFIPASEKGRVDDGDQRPAEGAVRPIDAPAEGQPEPAPFVGGADDLEIDPRIPVFGQKRRVERDASHIVAGVDGVPLFAGRVNPQDVFDLGHEHDPAPDGRHDVRRFLSAVSRRVADFFQQGLEGQVDGLEFAGGVFGQQLGLDLGGDGGDVQGPRPAVDHRFRREGDENQQTEDDENEQNDDESASRHETFQGRFRCRHGGYSPGNDLSARSRRSGSICIFRAISA